MLRTRKKHKPSYKPLTHHQKVKAERDERASERAVQIKATYKAERPYCERHLALWNQTVPGGPLHHIMGGSYGRVDEVWNLLVLCYTCHIHVHTHMDRERPRCIEIKRANGEWDQAAYERAKRP